MIRLNLKTGPAWLDLMPGVRVRVAPVTGMILTQAGKDAELIALDPDTDPDVRFMAFTKAVARIAISGWEGVGDADGNQIDPTPEAIGALMDLLQVNRAFAALYVAKGYVLADEKKGLAPLPNGTSAAAPDTADPATGSVPTVPMN